MAPLLSFKKTFDTTIDIGDIKLPIHVARLGKLKLDELVEDYNRLVVLPRGTAPRPPDDAPASEKAAFLNAEADRLAEFNKALDKDRVDFFERVITQYITLDTGLIEDCGAPVTDGEGLLRIFHGRRDVLRDLIVAVINENKLVPVMTKNSNSPRDSGTGSAPSSQARGGDEPGPTATSAGGSTTAAGGPATGASSDKGESSASSGASDAPTGKVH